MKPTAYIAQLRDSESYGMQSSVPEESDFDSFKTMCAKYRREGWDAAEAYFEPKMKAKDDEINRLKAELAIFKCYTGNTSSTQLVQTQHIYNYNAAYFPKPNAENIFEALIELTMSKREGGKYIINTKTDWYMV